MIFRILTPLIFIAIIAASFWLGGQQREAAAPITVENPNAELGYSARNAVLTETGLDGLPMYILNADVIRQRPGDGVDFDRVQMTFRDSGGQTWTGRADHGALATDTGRVELQGNVHVDGLLPGSTRTVDLATQKLSVDTHEDIISTDEPVALNSIGRQLKSRGLKATLKEHHLVLKSNVHGTFSP